MSPKEADLASLGLSEAPPLVLGKIIEGSVLQRRDVPGLVNMRQKDDRAVWRWYFHEVAGEWPRFLSEDVKEPASFGVLGFRFIPGFAKSLGGSGVLSESLLSSYLRAWAAEQLKDRYRHLVYAAPWPFSGVSKIPIELGKHESALMHLAVFRWYSEKFERAQSYLNTKSVLSGAEASEYRATRSESDMRSVLDTQGSERDVDELLQERFTLGVQALVKEMQAVIAEPILPKSGTVSLILPTWCARP